MSEHSVEGESGESDDASLTHGDSEMDGPSESALSEDHIDGPADLHDDDDDDDGDNDDDDDDSDDESDSDGEDGEGGDENGGGAFREETGDGDHADGIPSIIGGGPPLENDAVHLNNGGGSSARPHSATRRADARPTSPLSSGQGSPTTHDPVRAFYDPAGRSSAGSGAREVLRLRDARDGPPRSTGPRQGAPVTPTSEKKNREGHDRGIRLAPVHENSPHAPSPPPEAYLFDDYPAARQGHSTSPLRGTYYLSGDDDPRGGAGRVRDLAPGSRSSRARAMSPGPPSDADDDAPDDFYFLGTRGLTPRVTDVTISKRLVVPTRKAVLRRRDTFDRLGHGSAAAASLAYSEGSSTAPTPAPPNLGDPVWGGAYHSGTGVARDSFGHGAAEEEHAADKRESPRDGNPAARHGPVPPSPGSRRRIGKRTKKTGGSIAHHARSATRAETTAAGDRRGKAPPPRRGSRKTDPRRCSAGRAALVAPFGGGSVRFGSDGIYARRPVDASYHTEYHGSIQASVDRARDRARLSEEGAIARASQPVPGSVPGIPVFGISAGRRAQPPAVRGGRSGRQDPASPARFTQRAPPFVVEIDPPTGPEVGPGSYDGRSRGGGRSGGGGSRAIQRPSSAFMGTARSRNRPASAAIIEARRSAGKKAWIPSIRPSSASATGGGDG